MVLPLGEVKIGRKLLRSALGVKENRYMVWSLYPHRRGEITVWESVE